MNNVKPRCYNCNERPAPAGSYFCSNKCARIWAEEIKLGDDEAWCGHCRAWVSPDQFSDDPEGCPRCRGPLDYPTTHMEKGNAVR